VCGLRTRLINVGCGKTEEKITVSCDAMQSGRSLPVLEKPAGSSFRVEQYRGGGSMFLQNVGNNPPDCRASYPRRQ
jgi:hypothetical protein